MIPLAVSAGDVIVGETIGSPARDPLREILAVHLLHDERERVSTALERRVEKPVDVGDVRMAQRRQRLRLAREAREAVGIKAEDFRKDLDRNVAM
jgi:hypothetical protein